MLHGGESRSCENDMGFTVVDLLMVILVIALFTALSLPLFISLREHYRLRLAAWQLTGDLRLARSKAVTTQTRYRLCFSHCGEEIPPEVLYLLQRKGGDTWVSEAPLRAVYRNVRLIAPENRESIAFTADGMTGQSSTLTLANSAGSYQVRLLSTGRVMVCRNACP